MLCEVCGEIEATVHLTQVMDGAVKKLHLCEECAEESGLNIHGPMSLTDMLFGMGTQQESEGGTADKRCPRCRMTRADFKKTSRLGCPACYDVFSEELAPLLSAMHKGTQHVGKVLAAGKPAAEANEKVALQQKQLKEAVAAENFEEAARLRDLIRREKEDGHKKKPAKRDDSGSH